MHVSKALCDIGSRVSLMPLSMATSIGMVKDMKPVQVTLQLANKSLVKLNGIVKDVLVKLVKFFLLVDFIILDIQEDDGVPIIFGRPFLTTGDVIISIKDESITLWENGEEVIFDVNYTMRFPKESMEYSQLDINEAFVEKILALEAVSIMDNSLSTLLVDFEEEGLWEGE